MGDFLFQSLQLLFGLTQQFLQLLHLTSEYFFVIGRGEEEPKVLFIEFNGIKSIAEIWIVLKIER